MKRTTLFKTFEAEINNASSLVLKAQKGLPVKIFDELSSVADLTQEELSSLINLTNKTVKNYRVKGSLFSQPVSEHLLQLIALYNKGSQLFTSVTDFNEWLRTPSYGLGGIVPFSLLHTGGGINMVMDELYRIEYGATA